MSLAINMHFLYHEFQLRLFVTWRVHSERPGVEGGFFFNYEPKQSILILEKQPVGIKVTACRLASVGHKTPQAAHKQTSQQDRSEGWWFETDLASESLIFMIVLIVNQKLFKSIESNLRKPWSWNPSYRCLHQGDELTVQVINGKKINVSRNVCTTLLWNKISFEVV